MLLEARNEAGQPEAEQTESPDTRLPAWRFAHDGRGQHLRWDELGGGSAPKPQEMHTTRGIDCGTDLEYATSLTLGRDGARKQ